MKKSIVILVLLASVLLCVLAFAKGSGSPTTKGNNRNWDRDGYKGTNVAPRQSTNPDSSLRNNDNHPGNNNPNSGTKTPGNPDTDKRTHK